MIPWHQETRLSAGSEKLRHELEVKLIQAMPLKLKK
jgi:hypothetical protein